MSNLTNMQRKIIFATGILFLFVAMYPYKSFLHAEATKRDLGEATIGEVDTGSFMLKLALLGGARGIAANVLWMKADELKRNQDWDKMKVTVNLITKLQPHFLEIWTFQSWNLAYNVSVEWDAPEDKYEWIKQGIQFVQEGVSRNQKSPDLIWDTAWYYYHKLGFADESIILRRLFRDDTEESFKRDPLDNNVYGDNFQLARGWFTRAVRLAEAGNARLVAGTSEDVRDVVEYVDAKAQRKGRPDDLAFRAMPAHAQTRYAANLEKESMVGIPATFGEVAKNEWSNALKDWVAFGRTRFKTHNEVLVDGKLTRMDVYIDDATDPVALSKLHENAAYWSRRWAEQMNYPYWKDRSDAEREQDGVDARALFYEGTKAYKAADLPGAVQKFQEGLKVWERLLSRHKSYRDDLLNQKDTGLIVKRYERACLQLGIEVPKDTPFLNLLAAAQADTTVDPFDALEMISRPNTGASAAGQGQARPATPPR